MSSKVRTALVRWYERNRRDLPWRRTRDPYAIWISEIMLQQTRVAAVIPYYQRFLETFPDVRSLAEAPEEQVLALWSGLGYYSRARNLQKAARQIADSAFPSTYDALRQLAGVGGYTAAAVASIAFGLPHAVVDGNVRRVIVRLLNDNDAAVQQEADRLLDQRDPGRFNQALMELGAVVCTPRDPCCKSCPVARHCQAFANGTQSELPRKAVKPATIQLDRTLLVIRRHGRILLVESPRVKGFWDLPEPANWTKKGGVKMGEPVGTFHHTITFRRYTFEVREGTAASAGKSMKWIDCEKLHEIPLSTAAKKAMVCLQRQEVR